MNLSVRTLCTKIVQPNTILGTSRLLLSFHTAALKTEENQLQYICDIRGAHGREYQDDERHVIC